MGIKYDCIFIFGAGASRGTHPTIEKFFPSVEEALRTADNLPFEKYRELLSKIKAFKTPDRYAKHLFDSGVEVEKSEELVLIKQLYNTWIDYFGWSDFYPGVCMARKELGLQFVGKSDYARIGDGWVVDKRYLKFFENLNQKKSRRSQIYTWNYDHSIEFSIQELGLKDFSGRTIHLNGRAARPYEAEHQIKFFWENREPPREIELASNYVFIGYSFPEENFEQDFKFIEAASRAKANIYLQNPETISPKLKELLRLNNRMIDALNVKDVSDVHQFLIPR